MRFLVAGALAAGLAVGCAARHAVSTTRESAPADPVPSADVFRTQIAPLLAQKCAPCHNPGGKMYATMPFDDPATITSHAEGVLRRIKTPEEHRLIEEWIASRPTP